jgi:AcrR family transcriptional regulator
MARPKKSEARNTRQAILDQALRLFADHGFFGTSMRQIARAVGVRESALYHHFPSKDAVFRELVTQLGPGRIGQVMTIDTLELARAVGVKQMLRKLLDAVVMNWTIPEEQMLFRVMLQEGMRLAAADVVRPANTIMRVRARLMAILAQLAKHGLIRKLDPQATSAMLMGALMMLRVVYQGASSDFPALQKEAARIADQLWAFLQPTAPAGVP